MSLEEDVKSLERLKEIVLKEGVVDINDFINLVDMVIKMRRQLETKVNDKNLHKITDFL